jgi:hypothetical protein
MFLWGILLSGMEGTYMPDDYDALIAGEYSGDVQFIESKSGAYFGDALTRSSTPATWTLRLARFTENYRGETGRVEWIPDL